MLIFIVTYLDKMLKSMIFFTYTIHKHATVWDRLVLV